MNYYLDLLASTASENLHVEKQRIHHLRSLDFPSNSPLILLSVCEEIITRLENDMPEIYDFALYDNELLSSVIENLPLLSLWLDVIELARSASVPVGIISSIEQIIDEYIEGQGLVLLSPAKWQVAENPASTKYKEGFWYMDFYDHLRPLLTLAQIDRDYFYDYPKQIGVILYPDSVQENAILQTGIWHELGHFIDGASSTSARDALAFRNKIFDVIKQLIDDHIDGQEGWEQKLLSLDDDIGEEGRSEILTFLKGLKKDDLQKQAEIVLGSWIREFVADIYSVWFVGPLAHAATIEYILTHSTFLGFWQGTTEHPPLGLRNRVMLREMERLGYREVISSTPEFSKWEDLIQNLNTHINNPPSTPQKMKSKIEDEQIIINIVTQAFLSFEKDNSLYELQDNLADSRLKNDQRRYDLTTWRTNVLRCSLSLEERVPPCIGLDSNSCVTIPEILNGGWITQLDQWRKDIPYKHDRISDVDKYYADKRIFYDNLLMNSVEISETYRQFCLRKNKRTK